MNPISDQEFLRRAQLYMAMTDRERSASEAKLLNLAFNGEGQKLGEFLKTGVNPNACNSEGDAALHITFYPGCILFLLEGRADPTMKNNAGCMPIETHIKNNNSRVVVILMRYMKREHPELFTVVFRKRLLDLAVEAHRFFKDEYSYKTKKLIMNGLWPAGATVKSSKVLQPG